MTPVLLASVTRLREILSCVKHYLTKVGTFTRTKLLNIICELFIKIVSPKLFSVIFNNLGRYFGCFLDNFLVTLLLDETQAFISGHIKSEMIYHLKNEFFGKENFLIRR
jgi:hypothetical protein